MNDVADPEHRRRAARVREWLALLRDSDDLRSVGAYAPGNNPKLDKAIDRQDAIEALLCQSADTSCRFADAIGELHRVTDGVEP
jgi:flagellum-specific ATP synthase